MGAIEFLPVDFSRYVGIRYLKDGRDEYGADCWGLVRLIYRERMGIELPSISNVDTFDNHAVSERIALEAEQWLAVDSPRTGDVILLRIGGEVCHIGIVSSPGKFLHCRDGFDAAEESYVSGKWKHRVAGFYRYDAARLSVVVKPHPLQQKRIDCFMKEGQSLADLHAYISAHTTGFPSEAMIFVGGLSVPKEMWPHCRPKSGTEISYRAVLRSSGAGRIIALIAIAILSVYTGGLAAAAFASFGPGIAMLAGAGAAAAVSVVGNMLLNAIFPVRPPETPDTLGPGRAFNLLQGGSNQLTPYGAVPLLLGRMRYSAILGAKPYYETASADTYLRMSLIWGYGPLQVTDIRLGDAPIWTYEEVETQTLDGLNDTTDEKKRYNRLSGNDVEQLHVALDLEPDGEYLERSFTQEADEIAIVIVWPQGLHEMVTEGGRAGKIRRTEVRLSIQVKQTGVGSWGEVSEVVPSEVVKLSTAYYNTDNDPQLESVYRWYRISLDKYNNILVREGSVTTNPDEDPTGDLLDRLKNETFGYNTTFSRMPEYGPGEEGLWDICVYGDSVFQTVDRRGASGGGTVVGCGLTLTGLSAAIDSGSITRSQSETLVVAKKTSDAFSSTVKFKVARGAYDVRVRRTDTNEEEFKYPSGNDGQRVNTTVFQNAIAYLNRKPISFSKPLARTAIRIRASDQLSGGAPAIAATCTSLCKDYNYVNGTWSVRPTRNPASLLRLIYQGPMNANPDPDSALDLDWFAEFHDWCRVNKFTFDKLYTEAVSLDSIARDICAAGRASPLRIDGKRAGVIDRPRSTVVQHFTDHNSWGFSGERILPDLPHGFRVHFNNAERGYQPDQRTFYADGYNESNATKFEGMDLPGQTVPETIYSHARFHMGQVVLRPEQYTLTTDWENLVCTRGDLVRVTSDASMFGVGSARIKQWVDSTTLILDESLPMLVGTSYSIRVRTETGESVVVGVQDAVAEGRYDQLILTSPISEGDGAPGNLVQFGVADQESVELIVQSIRPGPDFSATLTLVDYSPAIYSLDNQAIPEFNSNITSLPEPAVLKLIQRPVVYSINSGETATSLIGSAIVLNIKVSFDSTAQLPAGVTHVQAQITPSEGTPDWKLTSPAFIGDGIVFTGVDQGSSFDLRFRYFDLTSGTHGPWTDVVTHIVVGLGDLEPVDDLQLATQNGVQKLVWSRPSGSLLVPADYELRVGDTYAGSFIGRTLVTEWPLMGEGHYWVSARYLMADGQYTYSGWDSILVEGDAFVQNVIVTFDEQAQGWRGELENMAIVGGAIELIGAGDILDAPDILALDEVLYYGGIAAAGSYTFPEDETVDVGRVSNCGVRIDYSVEGLSLYDDVLATPDILAIADVLNSEDDVFVYATPQISIAGEDVVFGEWFDLVPGLITARYFKARLKVFSTDATIKAIVSELILTIDVPDRDETYPVTTSAAGTVSVVFDPPFNGGPGPGSIPLVQGTIIDAAAGDDLRITGQSKTGCIVDVVNAGSRVVRSVNILPQGF